MSVTEPETAANNLENTPNDEMQSFDQVERCKLFNLILSLRRLNGQQITHKIFLRF